MGIDYGGPGKPGGTFGLDINWEPLQHFRKDVMLSDQPKKHELRSKETGKSLLTGYPDK